LSALVEASLSALAGESLSALVEASLSAQQIPQAQQEQASHSLYTNYPSYQSRRPKDSLSASCAHLLGNPYPS
jgi:hypothetical protein